MLYLPPLRRLLLPSLLCLAFILYYRSTSSISASSLSSYLIQQPELSPPGIRIAARDVATTQIVVKNVSENYLSPPRRLYYNYNEPGAAFENGTKIELTYADPSKNPWLQPLLQCPFTPNRFTNHIRFPQPLYNISLFVKGESENEKLGYLNPAIISLPHWSENQYLLISRVATDGSHQQNLLCEANICHGHDVANPPKGQKPCDAESLRLLGSNGGMRCATPPITLNVPPTPAESCGDGMGVLMDIPGFHDPRVFWSGKGEPLMMVNSQSRYACFGLWVIDLRRIYFPLEHLLGADPFHPSLGPLMSYPSLTEITRNPPNTRGVIEKNWMFFSSPEGSYIHYDMGPQRRSFAKLLGGGLTTVNLTDPMEMPCLEDAQNPSKEGSWHQGTNSLRLVLCNRGDESCKANDENQVFFSLIHHKHKGFAGLPLRYERYFIVWSAVPPFSMMGVSRFPLLFANETAFGFTEEENWDGDAENERLVANGQPGKGLYAGFTYTVSIAYAWGRAMDEPHDKNTGHLDDEIILGVGVDDAAMVYTKIMVKDALSCLYACPGRSPTPLTRNHAEEDSARAYNVAVDSSSPQADEASMPHGESSLPPLDEPAAVAEEVPRDEAEDLTLAEVGDETLAVQSAGDIIDEVVDIEEAPGSEEQAA